MEEVTFESQRDTYDDRLRIRILHCDPDAVEAAVALMERHDPDSLEDALELLPRSADLPLRCQGILVDAWDRYFHIRSMSWD